MDMTGTNNLFPYSGFQYISSRRGMRGMRDQAVEHNMATFF